MASRRKGGLKLNAICAKLHARPGHTQTQTSSQSASEDDDGDENKMATGNKMVASSVEVRDGKMADVECAERRRELIERWANGELGLGDSGGGLQGARSRGADEDDDNVDEGDDHVVADDASHSPRPTEERPLIEVQAPAGVSDLLGALGLLDPRTRCELERAASIVMSSSSPSSPSLATTTTVAASDHHQHQPQHPHGNGSPAYAHTSCVNGPPQESVAHFVKTYEGEAQPAGEPAEFSDATTAASTRVGQQHALPHARVSKYDFFIRKLRAGESIAPLQEHDPAPGSVASVGAGSKVSSDEFGGARSPTSQLLKLPQTNHDGAGCIGGVGASGVVATCNHSVAAASNSGGSSGVSNGGAQTNRRVSKYDLENVKYLHLFRPGEESSGGPGSRGGSTPLMVGGAIAFKTGRVGRPSKYDVKGAEKISQIRALTNANSAAILQNHHPHPQQQQPQRLGHVASPLNSPGTGGKTCIALSHGRMLSFCPSDFGVKSEVVVKGQQQQLVAAGGGGYLASGSRGGIEPAAVAAAFLRAESITSGTVSSVKNGLPVEKVPNGDEANIYQKYITKFGSTQQCGHAHCAYQYKEHYHCTDPECNYQRFTSKQDVIRHYNMHKKRDNSLQHGFMRFSPLDDCSAHYSSCHLNGRSTHYHCMQVGCTKVYTSTSDVMTHENFHKKNAQLISDGFQRYRATEDCGTASCTFHGHKTTHFHCRRSGCCFTFKNKCDVEKHKSYHVRDDAYARDGFKKFYKYEWCGFAGCAYARATNHFHCIRPGCAFTFTSTSQMTSHKRKHERRNSVRGGGIGDRPGTSAAATMTTTTTTAGCLSGVNLTSTLLDVKPNHAELALTGGGAFSAYTPPGFHGAAQLHFEAPGSFSASSFPAAAKPAVASSQNFTKQPGLCETLVQVTKYPQTAGGSSFPLCTAVTATTATNLVAMSAGEEQLAPTSRETEAEANDSAQAPSVCAIDGCGAPAGSCCPLDGHTGITGNGSRASVSACFGPVMALVGAGGSGSVSAACSTLSASVASVSSSSTAFHPSSIMLLMQQNFGMQQQQQQPDVQPGVLLSAAAVPPRPELKASSGSQVHGVVPAIGLGLGLGLGLSPIPIGVPLRQIPVQLLQLAAAAASGSGAHLGTRIGDPRGDINAASKTSGFTNNAATTFATFGRSGTGEDVAADDNDDEEEEEEDNDDDDEDDDDDDDDKDVDNDDDEDDDDDENEVDVDDSLQQAKCKDVEVDVGTQVAIVVKDDEEGAHDDEKKAIADDSGEERGKKKGGTRRERRWRQRKQRKRHRSGEEATGVNDDDLPMKKRAPGPGEQGEGSGGADDDDYDDNKDDEEHEEENDVGDGGSGGGHGSTEQSGPVQRRQWGPRAVSPCLRISPEMARLAAAALRPPPPAAPTAAVKEECEDAGGARLSQWEGSAGVQIKQEPCDHIASDPSSTNHGQLMETPLAGSLSSFLLRTGMGLSDSLSLQTSGQSGATFINQSLRAAIQRENPTVLWEKYLQRFPDGACRELSCDFSRSDHVHCCVHGCGAIFRTMDSANKHARFHGRVDGCGPVAVVTSSLLPSLLAWTQQQQQQQQVSLQQPQHQAALQQQLGAAVHRQPLPSHVQPDLTVLHHPPQQHRPALQQQLLKPFAMNNHMQPQQVVTGQQLNGQQVNPQQQQTVVQVQQQYQHLLRTHLDSQQQQQQQPHTARLQESKPQIKPGFLQFDENDPCLSPECKYARARHFHCLFGACKYVCKSAAKAESHCTDHVTPTHCTESARRHFHYHSAQVPCPLLECEFRSRGHYHCARGGCEFATNVSTKLPWHVKKHDKAERRAANGFKYYTKRDECGRDGCKYGRVSSHFHCIRDGCSFSFLLKHQMTSHARKHARRALSLGNQTPPTPPVTMDTHVEKAQGASLPISPSLSPSTPVPLSLPTPVPQLLAQASSTTCHSLSLAPPTPCLAPPTPSLAPPTSCQSLLQAAPTSGIKRRVWIIEDMSPFGKRRKTTTTKKTLPVTVVTSMMNADGGTNNNSSNASSGSGSGKTECELRDDGYIPDVEFLDSVPIKVEPSLSLGDDWGNNADSFVAGTAVTPSPALGSSGGSGECSPTAGACVTPQAFEGAQTSGCLSAKAIDGAPPASVVAAVSAALTMNRSPMAVTDGAVDKTMTAPNSVLSGFLRFDLRADCADEGCHFARRATHYHCARDGCGYRFCGRTHMHKHAMHHERVDSLVLDDFRRYKAGALCPYARYIPAAFVPVHDSTLKESQQQRFAMDGSDTSEGGGGESGGGKITPRQQFMNVDVKLSGDSTSAAVTTSVADEENDIEETGNRSTSTDVAELVLESERAAPDKAETAAPPSPLSCGEDNLMMTNPKMKDSVVVVTVENNAQSEPTTAASEEPGPDGEVSYSSTGTSMKLPTSTRKATAAVAVSSSGDPVIVGCPFAGRATHFHCLRCAFACADSTKVPAHRKQHAKMAAVQAAGFRQFGSAVDCAPAVAAILSAGATTVATLANSGICAGGGGFIDGDKTWPSPTGAVVILGPSGTAITGVPAVPSLPCTVTSNCTNSDVVPVAPVAVPIAGSNTGTQVAATTTTASAGFRQFGSAVDCAPAVAAIMTAAMTAATVPAVGAEISAEKIMIGRSKEMTAAATNSGPIDRAEAKDVLENPATPLNVAGDGKAAARVEVADAVVAVKAEEGGVVSADDAVTAAIGASLSVGQGPSCVVSQAISSGDDGENPSAAKNGSGTLVVVDCRYRLRCSHFHCAVAGCGHAVVGTAQMESHRRRHQRNSSSSGSNNNVVSCTHGYQSNPHLLVSTSATRIQQQSVMKSQQQLSLQPQQNMRLPSQNQQQQRGPDLELQRKQPHFTQQFQQQLKQQQFQPLVVRPQLLMVQQAGLLHQVQQQGQQLHGRLQQQQQQQSVFLQQVDVVALKKQQQLEQPLLQQQLQQHQRLPPQQQQPKHVQLRQQPLQQPQLQLQQHIEPQEQQQQGGQNDVAVQATMDDDSSRAEHDDNSSSSSSSPSWSSSLSLAASPPPSSAASPPPSSCSSSLPAESSVVQSASS